MVFCRKAACTPLLSPMQAVFRLRDKAVRKRLVGAVVATSGHSGRVQCFVLVTMLAVSLARPE